MKTVLDDTIKKELEDRIQRLDLSAEAQWGKMNVHQMICHLTDQLRDLNGSRPVAYEGTLVTRFVLLPLLTRVSSWPKAVFPAAKAYDQLKGGTKPMEFISDKKELVRMLGKLEIASLQELPLHPAFGKLSAGQYARIIYQHFDHNLKQFGV